MTKHKSNPRKTKFNQQLRSKLRKKRYILAKHISNKNVYKSQREIVSAVKTHLRKKWGLFGFACIEKRFDVVYFSKAPTNYIIFSTERDLIPMVRSVLTQENVQTLSVHGCIRKTKEVAVQRLKKEGQKAISHAHVEEATLHLLELGTDEL